MTAHQDDEQILVAVKTSMMPRPTTALLPRHLTVAQAVEVLRQIPPKDADASRVVQQLERETASRTHDFLAVSRSGEIAKVPPSTTLQSIAVPREIRTARGLETIPTAAFEIQAYAPVGGA